MLANQCRGRHVLLVVIVFSLGRSTSWAQVPTERPLTTGETQIRALMARLDDPATRDPSDVQTIFADTFYIVHANGNMQSKAEWLDLRSRLRIRIVEWKAIRFFEYGDTVIVQGDVHRAYDMPDGRPADESRRMTQVWVKRDARWQLAASHGANLPK